MTELIIDTGADRVRVQNGYLIRQFLTATKSGQAPYIKIDGDYLIITSTDYLREGDIITIEPKHTHKLIKIPIHETSKYITMVLEGDNFDTFENVIEGDVLLTFDTMHKVRHQAKVPAEAVKSICHKLKDYSYETEVIFGDKLVSAYAQYKTKIDVKRGN